MKFDICDIPEKPEPSGQWHDAAITLLGLEPGKSMRVELASVPRSYRSALHHSLNGSGKSVHCREDKEQGVVFVWLTDKKAKR